MGGRGCGGHAHAIARKATLGRRLRGEGSGSGAIGGGDRAIGGSKGGVHRASRRCHDRPHKPRRAGYRKARLCAWPCASAHAARRQSSLHVGEWLLCAAPWCVPACRHEPPVSRKLLWLHLASYPSHDQITTELLSGVTSIMCGTLHCTTVTPLRIVKYPSKPCVLSFALPCLLLHDP